MSERYDRRTVYWTLNGRVPEPCLDPMRWAMSFEDGDRRVARTELMNGDVVVSTVFLGLDHNFMGDGPPILFETMVFGEEHLTKFLGHERISREEMGCSRYSTYDEAEKGHAAHVAKLEKQIWLAHVHATNLLKGQKAPQ